MNLAKKLAKIFSLIFFVVSLSSCDSGCVEADQFDGNSVTIKANPGSEAITGTYDGGTDGGDVIGGQKIDWTDTRLRSNGEQFLIQITGSWTPWFGSTTNDSELNNLPLCKSCAKKNGVDNCLCYQGETPIIENLPDGRPNPDLTIDCDSSDQDIPSKCSCTTNYGLATDYTAYHVPLNYEDKYGTVKPADDQDPCKYVGGMGMYIGLFGRSGNDNPVRVYHLFSEYPVCDINLNSDDECKDENGKDVTKYMFQSKNNTIFVKDDNNGNNSDDDGYDNGTATLHSANEYVKLIIYDSFYLDNTGSYNVTFFKGVGKKDDTGLLEYIVGLVEDSVLGKVDYSTCSQALDQQKKIGCRREGGIIKFMYKSIVTDSGFARTVQILLSLYIAFYGLATLMGVAAINKKELMTRTLKISLIIFFTSESSWYFYNEIIVSFFKDSMDYVIGMFMDLSDSNMDSQSSSIIISQMDRATDVSNSTRFSFIDLTIKKLLSLAAAKKIFGLLFGSFFGFLYIPIIYFIIAFFVYVMLLAASFYVVNLLKIVLVLSLGPVFMCFSLFAPTKSIFKKWISFLGSRSLEIIILFIILYNFVVLIDTRFVELLSYKTCLEYLGIPYLQIPILKARIDRSLLGWCSSFVGIAGLIFITKLVMEKIPYLCGYLIAIDGEANKDASSGVGRGQSGFDMARGMMGEVSSKGSWSNPALKAITGGAFSVAQFSTGVAVQAGTMVSRAASSSFSNSSFGKAISESAVGKMASKAYNMMPSSPRTAYRNSIIDAAITMAKKDAESKGLTGVKADMHVRKMAISAMQKKMHREDSANKPGQPKHYDPTGMKLAGINMTTVMRRLDDKLVKEPLKDFLKEEAKRQKSGVSGVLFGKEMQDKLKERSNEWAEKNLSGGKDAIKNHLNDLNSFVKEQSKMTTSEAAKAYSRDEVGRNKYLQHLKENEIKREEKLGSVNAISRLARKAYSTFKRDEYNDPNKQKEIMLQKSEKFDRLRKSNFAERNQFGSKAYRDNLTEGFVGGRHFDRKNVEKTNRESDKKSLRDIFNNSAKDITEASKAKNKEYDNKIGLLAGYIKESEKKRDGKLEELNKEKEHLSKLKPTSYKQQKELQEKQKEIEDKIKKIKKNYDAEIKRKESEMAEIKEKKLENEKETEQKIKALEENVKLKEAAEKKLEEAAKKDLEEKLKKIEELNKSKDIEDKELAERTQMEMLLAAERNVAKALEQQEEIRKAAENGTKEALDNLGGKYTLDRGLSKVNIDGRETTLFEEEAKLRLIQDHMAESYMQKDLAFERAEADLKESGEKAIKSKAEFDSEAARKSKEQALLAKEKRDEIAREYMEAHRRSENVQIDSRNLRIATQEAQKELDAANQKFDKLRADGAKNVAKLFELEAKAKELKNLIVAPGSKEEADKIAAQELNKREIANVKLAAENINKKLNAAQLKVNKVQKTQKKAQDSEEKIGDLVKEIDKSEKEAAILRSELISAANKREQDRLRAKLKEVNERSETAQKEMFKSKKTSILEDQIERLSKNLAKSESNIIALRSDSSYTTHHDKVADARARYADNRIKLKEFAENKENLDFNTSLGRVKQDMDLAALETKRLTTLLEGKSENDIPQHIKDSLVKSKEREKVAEDFCDNLIQEKRLIDDSNNLERQEQKIIGSKEYFHASKEEKEALLKDTLDAKKENAENLAKAKAEVDKSYAKLNKLKESQVADLEEQVKEIQKTLHENVERINFLENEVLNLSKEEIKGDTQDDRNAHASQIEAQELALKQEIAKTTLESDRLKEEEELAQNKLLHIDQLDKRESFFGNSKELATNLEELREEHQDAIDKIVDLQKKSEELKHVAVTSPEEAMLREEASKREIANAKFHAECLERDIEYTKERIASDQKLREVQKDYKELSDIVSQSGIELDDLKSDATYIAHQKSIQETEHEMNAAKASLTKSIKEKEELDTDFALEKAQEGLEEMRINEENYRQSMIYNAMEPVFAAHVDANKVVEQQVDATESLLNTESFDNVKGKLESYHDALDDIDKVKPKDFSADKVREAENLVQSGEAKDNDLLFLKNSFALERSQMSARAKLAKLDLSARNAELRRLTSKDPSTLTNEEKLQITRLEQEIVKFEEDARNYEQQIGSIDSKMQSLDS